MEKGEGVILLKSIGITGAIVLLFYQSLWAVIFFPVVWFFQKKEALEMQKEAKKKQLQEEFMHGIGVLNSALQAGLSMENAWRGTCSVWSIDCPL